MSDEDEIEVLCSDEEQYECTIRGKHSCSSWHPPTDEIVKLYNDIFEKGILELDWKCPGRRSPSPPAEDTDSRLDKETTEETEKPATEFDFDDLMSESRTTNITPRHRTPGSAKQLKGSGQKRVASFQNVMLDIRRQMRLEKLNQTPTKTSLPSRGRKLNLSKSGERQGAAASQND